MTDTLSITTPDPLFDPNKPVRVNGFLYLPARRVLAGKQLAYRMGFDGYSPPDWPEGFIIEPCEVEGLAQWADAMGVAVEEG